MPSLQDSIFIFVLALLLFGPQKLPELARQIGKLMGEFRRASNEFRMQMEEELRISEQEQQRKKIAAIEAAAPAPPVLESPSPAPLTEVAQADTAFEPGVPVHTIRTEPLPIATAGDINLMPPATGLPVSRTAPESPSSILGPILDSIPQTPDPGSIDPQPHTGSESTHG